MLFLLSSFLGASSNAEFIQDILPPSFEKPFTISLSHGEFDESLDVLNYADKLTGSKPKSAELSSLFLSYKFNKKKIKADALITNTKKVAISILTADCAPILFYDSKKKIINYDKFIKSLNFFVL